VSVQAAIEKKSGTMTANTSESSRCRSLVEKLNQARKDQEFWAQVAVGPNLSAAAAAWARDAARSKQAVVDLYVKALAHQRESEAESLAVQNTPLINQLKTKLIEHPTLASRQPQNSRLQPLSIAWSQIKHWALPALVLCLILWTFAPVVSAGIALTLFGALADKIIAYYRRPPDVGCRR
jgi:hypothetical protein